MYDIIRCSYLFSASRISPQIPRTDSLENGTFNTWNLSSDISGDAYHHVMRVRHTAECRSAESKGVCHEVENDLPFRKVGVGSVAQPHAPNLTNHTPDKCVYRRDLIKYCAWRMVIGMNNRGTNPDSLYQASSQVMLASELLQTSTPTFHCASGSLRPLLFGVDLPSLEEWRYLA